MIQSVKLKKLKLAQKTAITRSRKSKVIDNANQLISQTDEEIKSLAINKFAVRKAKRLKDLGKTREEISKVIIDLESSGDNIIDKTLSVKDSLKNISVDKKFIGMSVEDILKTVNGIPKDEPKQETSAPVEESKKPEKGLEVKTNSDTDTKDDIAGNNEKIYDYLIKNGEVDIAEYILNLMTAPEPKSDNKTSDIEQNTKEIKYLSSINKEILEKLKELDVEKQDTSISIPQRLEQEVENEKNAVTEEKPEKTGSFISAFLKMLLGDKIFDLLTKSGTLLSLGKTLISSTWGWLKDKILKVMAVATKPIYDLLKKFKILPQKGIDTKKTVKTDTDKKPKKVSQATAESKTKQSKKPQKLSESHIPKTSSIVTKLAKFAKFVPIIGTAITAGSAVYSAQEGYNNAAEILGVKESDLNELERLAAAAGSVVNDVTFGVIPTKTTAEKILRMSGDRKIKTYIEKYKKYIDHDYIGKSEITDWEGISKLPAADIQNIISIDDWSKDDKATLEGLKHSAESRVNNPNKVGKSTDLYNKTNIDQKQKNNEINDLRTEIEFLKREYQKAKSDKQAQKIRNLTRNINQKQQDLSVLESRINDNFENIDKSEATKDKRLSLSEKAYQNVIKYTKAYDNARVQQVAQFSPNINSINQVNSQKKKPDSFQIFDNMRG